MSDAPLTFRKVPLVNLEAQICRLRPAIMDAIGRVIDSRAFIKGEFVSKFEKEFAASCHASHAIGNANGTSAIAVALEACGVGRGDEVIVPSHTFIASAEAICHVGAHPVFVDINPQSYSIDSAAVEAAITSKTRAILVVHLYGAPADMKSLMRISERRGLALIEDCAQAHLAEYGGQKCGTFGAAGTFSFYPGKNLGAFGDAGMVVTNDHTIATTVRKLSDHGRLSKYEHDLVGYNYRMDGIQAAVLSAKLPFLAGENERRRAAAAMYDRRLKPMGFKVIEPLVDTTSAYHLYVVEVENRTEVQQRLAIADIETGIHYPLPLHLQPAFADLGGKKGQFPETEFAAAHVLSLPICGDITDDQIDYVSDLFLATARPARAAY